MLCKQYVFMICNCLLVALSSPPPPSLMVLFWWALSVHLPISLLCSLVIYILYMTHCFTYLLHIWCFYMLWVMCYNLMFGCWIYPSIESFYNPHYVDGLVQDCSIPSALAMEILQSCTKPFIHILRNNIKGQKIIPWSTRCKEFVHTSYCVTCVFLRIYA